MKKAILFAAALTLAAAPAFAQQSLFYSFGQCAGDVGATPTATFDCSDFASTDAYITYRLAAATSGVVAISGGVDVTIIGASDVPAYWHLEGGGCNSAGLGIDDARGTLCTNAGGLPVFSGSGGTSSDAFITAYGVPFGGPNKARILFSVVRASSNPASLTNARQFGARLQFFDDAAVEAGGTCAGCDAQVSQVLQWILLENTTASTGGDGVAAYIQSTDAGSQPGVCINGAGCDIVPVKNRTWGVLKSLYR